MAISIERNRKAFTLVETLLVLAIIALIIAILLPAIQQAREAASRTSCANSLRQAGLALQMHHDSFGVLPSNGGWDGQQTILDVYGNPTTIYTHENFLGLTFNYGVGDPTLSPAAQMGSWAFAILPFFEQRAVYQQRDWGFPPTLFICPSRRRVLSLVATDDQYGSYNGGGWPWGKTDYAANALAIPNRPQCLRFEMFIDGLSHTILLGEKAMNPQNNETGTWYWDEPYFAGGSGGTQRGFGSTFPDGLLIVRDSVTMGLSFRYNWGSPHSSGAQFLFADGSLRLLSYDTPPTLVRAFLTPAGGELLPED